MSAIRQPLLKKRLRRAIDSMYSASVKIMSIYAASYDEDGQAVGLLSRDEVSELHRAICALRSNVDELLRLNDRREEKS